MSSTVEAKDFLKDGLEKDVFSSSDLTALKDLKALIINTTINSDGKLDPEFKAEKFLNAYKEANKAAINYISKSVFDKDTATLACKLLVNALRYRAKIKVTEHGKIVESLKSQAGTNGKTKEQLDAMKKVLTSAIKDINTLADEI